MNDPEISDYLQWTCSTHSWPEIFWYCYTKALRRSDFLVFSILLLKANFFVYVVVVAVFFLICKILRYWYTLVHTCDLLSEISAFVTCHLNFSFTVTWFRFWAVFLFLFSVLCVYQEYFLCFWYSSMYYCNVPYLFTYKAHSVIRRTLNFRRRLWQVSKIKISPKYPVIRRTQNYRKIFSNYGMYTSVASFITFPISVWFLLASSFW